MLEYSHLFSYKEIVTNDEDTKDIPIIAITVLYSTKDVDRVMKCEVAAYLPKPFDADKLLSMINNILGV